MNEYNSNIQRNEFSSQRKEFRTLLWISMHWSTEKNQDEAQEMKIKEPCLELTRTSTIQGLCSIPCFPKEKGVKIAKKSIFSVIVVCAS